jgi:hypothetical protein
MATGILRALVAILVAFQDNHHICLWTHRDPKLDLDLLQQPTSFATGSVLGEGCDHVSIWSGVDESGRCDHRKPRTELSPDVGSLDLWVC